MLAEGAGKNSPDFYVFSLFSAITLLTKIYNLSLDSLLKDTLLETLGILEYCFKIRLWK